MERRRYDLAGRLEADRPRICHQAGDYEIWYASDRVDGTFAPIAIIVE